MVDSIIIVIMVIDNFIMVINNFIMVINNFIYLKPK